MSGALTRPKGRTLPALSVLFPMWAGVGLLAPIAVGLPLGLIGQAVVGGSPAPSENELEDWVYALVYGGFVAQAVGLVTAFLLYSRSRWATLFRLRMHALPQRPRRSRRTRTLTDGAAAVAFAYAGTHIAWAAAGDGLAAPPGFDTVAQRVFLASIGVLIAAGAGATLALVHGSRLRPPWDRTILLVAIAWVGTAVAFGSGLAELALAPPDRLAPGTSVTLAAGSLSGLIMAVAAYRRVTRPAADEHTRTTAGTGSST